MTKKELQELFYGELLEGAMTLTLTELSHACQLSTVRITKMIEVGLIEPIGRDPADWRFHGMCVRRVRLAQRLERDLGVNTAGAALALELLEEIERIRLRIRRYESKTS